MTVTFVPLRGSAPRGAATSEAEPPPQNLFGAPITCCSIAVVPSNAQRTDP